MALNRKLQAFSSTPRIKLFSKLLDKIEADLKELACVDLNVDILQEEKKGSAIKRFLSFQLSDIREPDQMMAVTGTALSRAFSVMIPFKKGGTLPYFLEVELNASPGEKLEFKKAFVGGKWVLEQKNKEKLARLNNLKLPDINWTHARGDFKFKIVIAHQIIPDEENPSKSTWIIHSGYQGFLVNVGPKVAKYIKASQDVESFLNAWK